MLMGDDGIWTANDDENLIVQCECGRTWAMDFEPVPDECLGSIWRLRDGEGWGVWVDKDGNEVSVEDLPEVRE